MVLFANNQLIPLTNPVKRPLNSIMPLFPTGSHSSQGASDDQSQDRRQSTYSTGGESYGHSVHSSDNRPASSDNRPTTGRSGQSIAPSYSSVRSGGPVGTAPGQLPGRSGMDGYFPSSAWSDTTTSECKCYRCDSIHYS
jgi:hypothetical protein